MSRDYQLAPTTTTTPAATDFWTQGGTAVLAPPMPAAPAAGVSVPPAAKLSMVTRAHRLLRGRYPLALTLAVAGATAGAVAGFALVAPRWSATGMVAVDPRIINPIGGSGKLDDLNTVLANQMGFLDSPDIAATALADKDYREAFLKAYPGLPVPDVQAFLTGITIDRPRNETRITAAYSDKSPRVAEAAATALMRAYQASEYSSDPYLMGHEPRMSFDQDQLKKVDAELAARTKDMEAKTNEAGGAGELDLLVRNQTDIWLRDQGLLKVAQQEYADAQAAAREGRGGPDPKLVYEQIAAYPDRQMQMYLKARDDDEAYLTSLQARGVMGRNPIYTAAVEQSVLSAKRVDDYAREWLTRYPNAIASTLDGNGKTSLDVQRARVDRLTAAVQQEHEEVGRLAAARLRVAEANQAIDRLRAERDTLNNTLESMRDQQTLSHIITVTMPGEAIVQSNRRVAAAGALFLLGGLLPIGAMMLYGMGDSRFRYSDEATEADLAGVALLGILPNLPDRLSDPQQAGIAAHCVHQIRTMLQISRANDEPQVLAVTSAAAGDGKTSLTLALGLSYAACGARTLLIDCDLLAAGLTHRLNVASPDGVLEAVANRALLEYVRTTDIADVAILPVGTTHAHHASTLSPVALRRLLSEAKKQFDIIVVDTGPILASIEASLICAAADRTVLAVARNQQRPLVERSIGHLQAIGANLAGVVFNRAQAKDFEKSMSGLALRSRPAAGNPAAGGNTADGQSVAKAVAGSFKRAG